MPPMQLFGYSMFFAGDDLHVLSFIGIIVRFAQLGVLIPSFIFLSEAMEQSNSYYDTYYDHIIYYIDHSSSLNEAIKINETENFITSLDTYDDEVQSSQNSLLLVFILSLSTAVLSIPIEIMM